MRPAITETMRQDEQQNPLETTNYFLLPKHNVNLTKVLFFVKEKILENEVKIASNRT